MAKVVVEDGMAWIRCPGCGYLHGLNIDPARERPRWTFDGDLNWPTFEPSLLVRSQRRNPETDQMEPTVCHSFIRSGRMQYLDDCTHGLRGQTVDLIDVSEKDV